MNKKADEKKELDLILPENVPTWERTSILPIIMPFLKKKTVIFILMDGT